MWKTNSEQANKESCNDTSGKLGPNKECEFKVRGSRYTDLRATVKYIYRTEGAIAFTKGILPRMSINVPSTALSWGTYELIKSRLLAQPED